jgi:hypothetical protein
LCRRHALQAASTSSGHMQAVMSSLGRSPCRACLLEWLPGRARALCCVLSHDCSSAGACSIWNLLVTGTPLCTLPAPLVGTCMQTACVTRPWLHALAASRVAAVLSVCATAMADSMLFIGTATWCMLLTAACHVCTCVLQCSACCCHARSALHQFAGCRQC